MKDFNNKCNMSREEELALIGAFKSRRDEAAYEKLAGTLKGYIVNRASYYERICNSPAVDKEDLIQEGYRYLIRALEKFDASKGFRLSTYASWWIEQAMSRYTLEQGNAVSVPVRKQQLLFRIRDFRNRYLREFGVEPAVDEIAFGVGVDPEKIAGITDCDIRVKSLDCPVSFDEESDCTLADMIPSGDEDILTGLERKMRSADMIRLCSEALTPRESEVIRLIYFEDMSITGAGKILGYTRETVRKDLKSALSKLRDELVRTGWGPIAA